MDVIYVLDLAIGLRRNSNSIKRIVIYTQFCDHILTFNRDFQNISFYF